MKKKLLLPYVLVPTLVIWLVTAVRAWLEVHSPDAPVTFFVSASFLSLAWILVVPAVMLKRGISLGRMLLVGLLFFVLQRAAVGAVYALARANEWTVEGTGEPVRYVAQMREQEPDASALGVFLGTTFIPVPFGLVFLLVIWTLTWAIAFRNRRPFAGAATAA